MRTCPLCSNPNSRPVEVFPDCFRLEARRAEKLIENTAAERKAEKERVEDLKVLAMGKKEKANYESQKDFDAKIAAQSEARIKRRKRTSDGSILGKFQLEQEDTVRKLLQKKEEEKKKKKKSKKPKLDVVLVPGSNTLAERKLKLVIDEKYRKSVAADDLRRKEKLNEELEESFKLVFTDKRPGFEALKAAAESRILDLINDYDRNFDGVKTVVVQVRLPELKVIERKFPRTAVAEDVRAWVLCDPTVKADLRLIKLKPNVDADLGDTESVGFWEGGEVLVPVGSGVVVKIRMKSLYK